MRRSCLVVLTAVGFFGVSLQAAAAEDKPSEKGAEVRELSDAMATVGTIVEAMRRSDAHGQDAPELLGEAVRTGRADVDQFAAIASWVLHAKEEDVARGLAAVLAGVDVEGRGLGGDRWNPTARAAVDVIVAALGEAQRFERRGAESLSPELLRLVAVAKPAVAATLREADPAAIASLARTARALGGAAFGDLIDGVLATLEVEVPR